MSQIEATQPFTSLEALRAVNDELLDLQDQQGENDQLWERAEDLVRRIRVTGALLDTPLDRRAAQSIWDYWAGLLYRADRPVETGRLIDFDPNLAPELPDEPAPYRGLEPFQEVQHDLFFGRQVLLNKLADLLRQHRFVAVVGASGSGKSSLVLGGLLPALKAGELTQLSESTTWRYSTPIVPSADPLPSLARAATSIAPSQLDLTTAARFTFSAEAFQRDATYLASLANTQLGPDTGDTQDTSDSPQLSDPPVCFVVDQFEEIFTLCTDEQARRAFVNNLIGLTQGDSDHKVIITMRSDYEDKVAKLPQLAELFQQAQVRVTAMSAGELRETIEAPANKVGLKFDEGVVDALLQDILGEPAGLPLLQFALRELWRTRVRNRATWSAYQKLGNAREGLARTADRLYDELTIEERETVRRILLRMVQPGVGSEVTSKRIQRGALHTLEASDRVDRVLERLNLAGLLRVTRGLSVDRDMFEVAHEALVRNWLRLLGWLDLARKDIRQRLILQESAQLWETQGRNSDVLLRGQMLYEASMTPDLSVLEVEYLEASYALKNLETERQQAELIHQNSMAFANSFRDVIWLLISGKPLAELLNQIIVQLVNLMHASCIEIYELISVKEFASLHLLAQIGGVRDLNVNYGSDFLEQSALLTAIVSDGIYIIEDLKNYSESHKDPFLNLIDISVFGSLLIVPIKDKSKLAGAVCLYFGVPHIFSQQELSFVQLIGEYVALAIGTAKLREHAIEDAAIVARQQLASELHDSVSQSIFGLSLAISTALGLLSDDSSTTNLRNVLRYARSMSDTALKEIRVLIYEMRAERIASEDLFVAIRKHVNAVNAKHDIHIVTRFLGNEENLKDEVKEAVYHVAVDVIRNLPNNLNQTIPAPALTIECLPDGGANLRLCIQPVELDTAISLQLESQLNRAAVNRYIEKFSGKTEIVRQEHGSLCILVEIPAQKFNNSISEDRNVRSNFI